MSTTSPQNIKSFYKGQVIFKEGQQGTIAYMVKKGSINLFRNVDGRKIVLERLGKGEIFGEMAALSGHPRTHSAEAAEFCELMVLTEQVIQTLLNRCPKTIQHLTKLLIRRLRKAGDGTQQKTHKSSFLSICRVLEMAYRCHTSMKPAEAKKMPGHKQGLPASEFAKQVKNILLVSQLEIDNTLDQLAALKIINITKHGSGKAFAERYIAIGDMENFFKVASNLYKELSKTGALEPELEYIDIHDLAEEVEANTEVLYKKMANKEIPETLFFFHKNSVMSWASDQEEDFFKRVKRKKKAIKDLEDVNDIVFVDNGTCKEVFAKLGYYKLGVLLAMAEDDAKKKILGNLAKKIAKIVQDEAEARGPVDPAEAEDVSDELIEMVKAAKGVNA
ncbi:cyclic nucleotide-binding domain-containing protein [Pseudodesulfovibrio sp. zrk46]|uniref:cyclic nucleotide-binding domain-containing protein n=1 Tax=Pseudodesulfovibrio sp. zrk46 TaxID=2725288 RepID=UPI0014490F67|nr:cyclic nucleotide-binding domain-containing protein [Pseudodesulfovibrio sp. zrk46]QJB55896.1 cyclic nucleotide-binding domain-containing protein [Pseudodesulfovibrio sp. zrk46]